MEMKRCYYKNLNKIDDESIITEVLQINKCTNEI